MCSSLSGLNTIFDSGKKTSTCKIKVQEREAASLRIIALKVNDHVSSIVLSPVGAELAPLGPLSLLALRLCVLS